ncbi:MAG: glycosyltransferase family 4 protein, partial [Thermoguttaceae bacterium]
MKIAYVCNEYPLLEQPGGIGIFTRAIAQELVRKGHDVTVIGYGKHCGEWYDDGVKVIGLLQAQGKGRAWWLSRRRLYEWLRDKARSRAIDLIEVPESHGLVPFVVHHCPVVLRLHLNLSTRARQAGRRPRWLLRQLEKRTLACHRNWIAVSDYILQTTKAEYRLEPVRSEVVYNPVVVSSQELHDIPPLPNSFVLYAGTVSGRKGAYVLAEAARSFLSRDRELHLVYAGGTIVENGYRADDRVREIVGNELSKRVHFIGFVPHDVVLA